MAYGPTSLQQYLSAAVGPDLANGISQTFGANIAADIAINTYARDNATATNDPNAHNLDNASGSAVVMDLAAKVNSYTTPQDRQNFITQVANTIGGNGGQAAAQALTDYYAVTDDKNPADLSQVQAKSALASSIVIAQLSAAVTNAQSQNGADTSGSLSNTTDAYNKIYGPTGDTNKAIHDYAAARAAQAAGGNDPDSKIIFNNLESAAQAKLGSDHAKFMNGVLKDPQQVSTMAAAILANANGGPVPVSPDMVSAANLIQSGENLLASANGAGSQQIQTASQNIITGGMQKLSAAQFLVLNGGIPWDAKRGTGNPDEQKALAGLGFNPDGTASAPVQQPAATTQAPAAPAAPQLHIFNFSSVPAPAQPPANVVPPAPMVNPTAFHGLNITGGHDVSSSILQVSQPVAATKSPQLMNI